jgi:pSer/pThr/pTyr-binding forkhead associated (FHA) protein
MEDDVIIGRQSDCSIVISDISVSRKHISISNKNGRYFLRDLGSGNGTYLGNEKIPHEGTEIQDGSVFKIGDTELTFSCASPVRRSPRMNSRETRRASGTDFEARSNLRSRTGRNEREAAEKASPRRGKPKKSKLKFILMSMFLLGLLVVVGKVAYQKNLEDQRIALELEEQRKEEEAIIDSIGEEVKKGRAATQKGDFKVAITHFQEAAKIAEAHDQKLPSDTKRQLDYATKEVTNQELIEQSRELAKNTKLKEAVQSLDKISENSFYYGKIPEIKDEFKEYFDGFMQNARQLLEQKNYEEAEAAVDEILAVNPRDDAALKLQAEILRAAELAKRPIKRAAAPVVEKEDVTAPILSVFYKGDVSAAIEQARACSEADCAKLAEKFEAFNAAFANVERDTEKAFSALMAIPGAQKSSFYGAIATKIATTLTKDGIREMGSENYSAAFKAFQRVLRLEAGNTIAKKHMVTIRQHANELFQQGYVEKGMDPEAARRKFEKVIGMTDSKDELNHKAKRHLSQLSGGF